MSRRHRVNRRHDKKRFTKTAVRTHKKNIANPMRGGIRL